MKREDTQNVQAVTHGNVTLKVYEVNRGNRTIFSVAHKLDGRRQLKQFGELAAALTWASNRAKEIDRGKAPSVMLSPDEGATYRRAVEILRGIGKPLDQVAREYVDAVDTLGGAARLDDAALSTRSAGCDWFNARSPRSSTNCYKRVPIARSAMCETLSIACAGSPEMSRAT